jgi:NAD(P)-dependent dehydrogenase (short-subunit alcohol dehydrogenase family)
VTLRSDLLEGRRFVIAGGAGESISEQLRALGAQVEEVDGETLGDEDAATDWMRGRTPLHGLVVCAADSFGAGGADRLQQSLELCWRAARAAATGALIEAGQEGRLVLVAPAAGSGTHVEALRAGLENLARTLSVEWARYLVTAVAVTPGPETDDDEVAELVAFLLSPAGGYFSGCRFDLGAIPTAS